MNFLKSILLALRDVGLALGLAVLIIVLLSVILVPSLICMFFWRYADYRIRLAESTKDIPSKLFWMRDFFMGAVEKMGSPIEKLLDSEI